MLISYASIGQEGDKLYIVLSGRGNTYVRMTQEERKNLKASEEERKFAGNIVHNSVLQAQKTSQNVLRKSLFVPGASQAPSKVSNESEEEVNVEIKLKTCPESENLPKSINIIERNSSVNSFQNLETENRRSSLKVLSTRRSPSRFLSQAPKNKPRIRILPENEEIVTNKSSFLTDNIALKLPNDSQNIITSANDLQADAKSELDESFMLSEQELEKATEGMKYLGTIGPGGIFGEIALTTGKKRLASIIVTEDCHVAVLSKESFNKLLLNLERQKFLRRMDFFESAFGLKLKWEKAVKLMYMFTKEKVGLNKNIFEDKQEADGFYVIKSGKILVIIF